LRVLTVNAGSSSLKLRLLGPEDDLLAERELEVDGGQLERDQVAEAVADMPRPDAVGHRIVHGGERFRDAVRIGAEVERALRELADLAPLHQPKSLAALDAVSAALPDLPAVACFDTAFHATLPAEAWTYALPAAWREQFGLRRYGFHGLSHAYATRRAAQLLGRSPRRLVVCHLGAGASLAAIADGRSVDTTMGFTPLEGLVMASRSGSVDPGMLLWLLEREAVSEREMAEALEHHSGLQGLAGTSDMAAVLKRAAVGDEDARLGRDVYVRSLKSGIAAMAASLGGLDALVFTGGVGENASEIRALALDGLAFLGIEVEQRANDQGRPDAVISATDSRVTVLVIHSREDIEMATQVRTELTGGPAR
jgi:acetate kinase